MNTFVVNGKTYKAKVIDFNTLCDLEDMGIAINSINRKPMAMIRAYFALCAEISVEEAGKEIGKHIVAGGTIGEISDAMQKEVDESDFFLQKEAEQKMENSQETEV